MTPAGTGLGIIAALPGEARALARLRPRAQTHLADGSRLLLSGMGAERATLAATKLADEGATALISWGTAAALAPGVEPGALVLPATVVDAEAREWPADADWRDALAAALAPAHAVFEQRLVEAPGILTDAAAKHSLYRQSGAIASDMESAAIAAVAAARGLKFVAVRAIIDDVSMTLPPVARATMDLDGRLQPAALVVALAGRPSAVHAQLRALKNLAVAFRAARASLADAARAVRSDPAA